MGKDEDHTLLLYVSLDSPLDFLTDVSCPVFRFLTPSLLMVSLSPSLSLSGSFPDMKNEPEAGRREIIIYLLL